MLKLEIQINSKDLNFQKSTFYIYQTISEKSFRKPGFYIEIKEKYTKQ
jgi:hypothetical protein